MVINKVQELASLLEQTGRAHHQAYIDTDGHDPEWALWYASHIQKDISSLLNKNFTLSKIVYELVRLAETADVEGKFWPEVYANELMERYG